MYHRPKVIIVEDEPVIAVMMQDLLSELGCKVEGCAYSEAQGFDLLAFTDAEVAFLDVHLGTTTSFALASACEDKGMSVIFTTGDDGSWMAAQRRQSPVVGKPISRSALLGALRDVGVSVVSNSEDEGTPLTSSDAPSQVL